MKKFLELTIGSAVPMMLVLAFMFAFMADTAFDFYDVIPGEDHGANSLKSDIGGFVLSYGIIALMFFRTKGIGWLKALIVMTAAISVMRLLSIIVDGVHLWGIGWLGLELSILGVMVYYMNRYGTKED